MKNDWSENTEIIFEKNESAAMEMEENERKINIVRILCKKNGWTDAFSIWFNWEYFCSQQKHK